MRSIPLSQLYPSPRNVRHIVGDALGDLAASIASHGLRQNLTVIQRAPDRFEVCAGGLRLRALQHLAKEGALPDTLASGIPCMLTTDEAATEVSLAENVMRTAMHPADEFDAFKTLADAGKTSDEIAQRFGCKPKHVEQRLRLARVAPEILDQYRAGKADLAQLMALTLTDDIEAQRAVWKSGERVSWMRTPHQIRRAITGGEVRSDTSLAKFVGLKAYEAAGGVARKDLFEGDIYYPDAALLERLALAKLQKTADKTQADEGWAWSEARLELSWADIQQFGKSPRDLDDDCKDWSAEAKAHAGVIVYIGQNGRAETERGLIRPEDRKQAATAAGGEDKIAGGKTAKPVKKPGDLSFSAVQRLQAEATAIVQRDLASKPFAALALLVADLAYDLSGTRYEADRRYVFIDAIMAGRVRGPHKQFAEESQAGRIMADHEDAWRNVLPNSRTKLREWALGQPVENLLNLLAFLVARSTEAIDGAPNTHPDGIVQLAALTKTPLSATWQPTEEWLATIPKATILEMVREANGRKGKAIADRIAKLKKDALLPAALAALPQGWLPAPLRGSKPRPKLDAKQKASGEREDEN